MTSIKLLVPRMPHRTALFKYLRRIDESLWYTNFGPLERELRARLEEKYGAHVVTVSSCTAGLELMYRHVYDSACGEPIDESDRPSIALPALTFAATALAAHREGLRVELEDVDPNEWTHPAVAGFGLPALGRWVDAAAAFGEQQVFPGQTAVFSLHATKAVGAGEGGYIVTHDARLAEKFRRQTNFGFDGGVSVEWGTNAKLSEYAAAIALASLDAWDREPWLRLHDWYKRYLPPTVTQQQRPRGVYPILAVLVPKGVLVESVVAKMAAAGIETRRWYCPILSLHPLFFGRKSGDLPVTNDISQRLIGLPYHLFLTEESVACVCGILNEVIRSLS